MRMSIALPLAIACGISATVSTNALAQDYKLCKGTYALCTVAHCDPIPGTDKQVSCHCTVHSGYSVGGQCQGPSDTPTGRQIISRYFPVKRYAICANDRPWAGCLDKPCIVDKNDPAAAACTCDVAKNVGNYTIAANTYTPDICTTGIISSATMEQVTGVTNFLKSHSKQLAPFQVQLLTASQ